MRSAHTAGKEGVSVGQLFGLGGRRSRGYGELADTRLLRSVDVVAVLPEPEPVWKAVHRPQGERAAQLSSSLPGFVLSRWSSWSHRICLAETQVENFLFYVLCDAATSRRDQVIAFFSKVGLPVSVIANTAGESIIRRLQPRLYRDVPAIPEPRFRQAPHRVQCVGVALLGLADMQATTSRDIRRHDLPTLLPGRQNGLSRIWD